MKKFSPGFSIIEILVSLSLITIATAAMMSLISNLNSNLNKATNKAAETTLINELNQTISDKDFCRNSITKPTEQIFDINQKLKLKFNLPAMGLIHEGTIIDNSIVIKELYVDNFDSPINTSTPGYKKTQGAIWLRSDDINSSNSLRRIKSIGILNLIYEDSSKKIKDCFGVGYSPQENCINLGFEWTGNTCREPAPQTCNKLGGTWNGTSCTISSVSNNLSILGKTCNGTNVTLIGFDNNGNPICHALPQIAGNISQPSLNAPIITTPATSQNLSPCSAGYEDVPAPDSSQTCHFEWNQTPAGLTISAPGAYMRDDSGKGGTASRTCVGENKWENIVKACPSSKGNTVCYGGSQTKISDDGSNSCTFTWNQGLPGQKANVTGNSGGSADGTCNSTGTWTWLFTCPNKTGAASCPGGTNTYGSCFFVWDQTPNGQGVINMRDTSGNGGTGTGFTCDNGTWKISGAKFCCQGKCTTF